MTVKPAEKKPAEKKPAIKKTTTVTEELIQEDRPAILEETEDTKNPAAYASAIDNWLKSVNTDAAEYTATLYKYDAVNKQKQCVIDERVSEILSMEDIGLSYGSGEYRYLISFPRTAGDMPAKAVKFNLHPVYDERREKLGLIKHSEDRGNGKGNLAESMEMLKHLAEIVKTMIPAPAPPAPDQAAMMIKNYEFMQSVLKKSLTDTSDLYKNLMMRDINNDDDPEKDPEEGGQGMKDIILPLLEKFVPVLLGEGPKAQLTADVIKKLPEFQKLLKDNEQLKGIVEAIKNEIGAAKTGKILKKLGVPA